MSSKTALLLVNVGTPADSTPEAVGAYLKEFLMDPYIIDIPWLLRSILVHLLIVPKRSYASAELYQNIWTKEGSPLLTITQSFEKKLQSEMGQDFLVLKAMRYGQPSIESAVKAAKEAQCDELIVFPLYPQYSDAATLSSEVKVKEVLGKLNYNPKKFKFIPPFYNHKSFIDAYLNIISKYYKPDFHEHLLFSYHGLPERQITKQSKETKLNCLLNSKCCDEVTEKNSLCYRAHCFATTRLLAQRLNLETGKYSTCFQSRLGRTPWIKPYTDELYESLPQQGIKKIAVCAPSFVIDCLETLEEIQLRGKEQFLAKGGEVFDVIPCLNDSDDWVKASVSIIQG